MRFTAELRAAAREAADASKAHATERWNPPGEFGALYLNATSQRRWANAQRHVESILGTVGTLYDLLPALRPQLSTTIS